MNEKFVRLAEMNELAPGRLKVVKARGTPVRLINVSGAVYALSAICTRAGCELEESGEVDGDELECTCHGSRFKVATVEVTSAPAQAPLKRSPVKVEGNEILVALDV